MNRAEFAVWSFLLLCIAFTGWLFAGHSYCQVCARAFAIYRRDGRLPWDSTLLCKRCARAARRRSWS